jgi:hypothetical protein
MGGFLPPIFDAQKCLVKKIALQKKHKICYIGYDFFDKLV